MDRHTLNSQSPLCSDAPASDRLRGRAGLFDLRFHALRHEAIPRFFEFGLNIPEVAVLSGHEDSRMLFRYTHLRAEELVGKFEVIDQRI